MNDYNYQKNNNNINNIYDEQILKSTMLTNNSILIERTINSNEF